MNNKQNYFTFRNKELQQQSNRKQLGDREVITLLTVLDIQDTPNSLLGKTIVDLGSGDQHLRDSLESRGATYIGIDIDVCNLEIDKIPLSSNGVDIAIGLSLIEHLHDPSNFLSEVKRILKPGGALWMDTPDIDACGTAFWNDPTHVHPYTRKSFRLLLEMNGFNNVLITPNYRCKKKKFYADTNFNFYRARKLMPFKGTSWLPVPEILKGSCTGLFALAKNH